MKLRTRCFSSRFQCASSFLLVFMLILNLWVLSPWIGQRISEDGDEDFECKKNNIEVQITSLTNVLSFNTSLHSTVQWNNSLINVVGRRRKNKGYLTIGIPSIKRINGVTYLMQTLDSLDQEMSAKEKLDNVVVVFLADFDAEYNNQTVNKIVEKYGQHLQMGFIQVITALLDYYPPLKNLKRNFNDDPSRVSWRAKQVADYALMFRYSQSLSTYYLQLEDDVTCGKDFLNGIRHYVDLQSKTESWSMLEFSELGFIGKLFRSSDLEKLASFMMMFYEEQPVDWLMTYFRLSMGQRKVLLRKPTLFQHFGLKSSFDITKDNKLKDRFFESGIKPWSADNPPATILSTMPSYESNTADLAYSSGSGFFWAAKVSAGDAIFVLFEQKQRLTKVIVETGNDKHPNDKLNKGVVFLGSVVGPLVLSQPDDVCQNTIPVANFTNGRAEANELDVKVTTLTHCIKILVSETHTNWVVFYQVAVFVSK